MDLVSVQGQWMFSLRLIFALQYSSQLLVYFLASSRCGTALACLLLHFPTFRYPLGIHTGFNHLLDIRTHALLILH